MTSVILDEEMVRSLREIADLSNWQGIHYDGDSFNDWIYHGCRPFAVVKRLLEQIPVQVNDNSSLLARN